jgi:membrane associated rhomboid family serine protease
MFSTSTLPLSPTAILLNTAGVYADNFIMKKGFHISYNAPVTVTFSLLCAGIFLLDQYVSGGKLIPLLFTVPGGANSPSPFEWSIPLSYIRLFTHVLGHCDWNHLLGNLTFILLLGPLMEEKYGSAMTALMMTVTAAVTGVINACFLSSSLLGASGIAFMLIVLASISTISKSSIPFSFLLVLSVFIAREILSPSASNISTIAHITGGLCGSLFAFLAVPKAKKKAGSPSKQAADDYKPRQGLTREEMLRRIRQLDESSPRYSSSPSPRSSEEDTTLVGTIEL